MIKIENTEVFGWEAAIRGMRNAKNSWDKSDSFYCCGDKKCAVIDGCDLCCDIPHFVIGENDLKLMANLIYAGDDHGKLARYLMVQCDIVAPFYWWKEFKTYRKGRKFLDDGDEFLDPEELEIHIETNSCSTMHKIHAKAFTLDDFSHEHLTDVSMGVLCYTIDNLNNCRELFLADKNKEWWWQMIQLLPSSYNQRRTVQLSYQVLKNMYFARKAHKLDEWRDFCKWVEGLPYFKEICIKPMEGKA